MLNALLWNLLITAGLAVMLTALCRLPALHKRPALRCWLWLLLVAKLITPPLLDLPLLPAVTSNNEAMISVELTAALPMPVNPTSPYELATLPDFQPDSVIEDPAASTLVEESSLNSGEAVVSPEPSRKTQMPYLAVLLTVSLIGTFVLLITCMVRAVRLNRWLRRACTDDMRLAQVCAEVAASLGIRRTVQTAVIDTRTTPLLWGWRTPMVVLPRPLLDDLGPESVRNIVAHELAHLLRRDTWANVFVFLVRSVMWWNPVAWWAERELRAAQELCCDAMAIDCCNASRRHYATTLLQALDFIQDDPVPIPPHALASRMGSRRSILRRFEMIVEKPLSYQLSRRTFAALLTLTLPLLCMPVRAQVEEPNPPAKVETKAPTSAKALAASAVVAELEAITKMSGAEQAKSSNASDTESLDPEMKALGKSVRKRITTFSDVEAFTLEDGQTGRMKVKKNLTPVTEILITAHFVEGGTKFELEGLDAEGKKIEGTKTNPTIIRDGKSLGTGLGKSFNVDGESIMSIISLSSYRPDDKTIRVMVKSLFTRTPTPEEMEAMMLTHGKDGKAQLDFTNIGRWIHRHKWRTGHYPKSLEELGESLPKDVYSPTGEGYHYEAKRTKYMLSSCGKDGIYGNDDDNIYISDSRLGITSSRHRRGMEPFDSPDILNTEPLDPEVKALGEAVRKRLSTYPNQTTLTLKDGETGRMKVKKNLTPVAEILITAHLLKECTKYDIQGLDADGKAMKDFKASVQFKLDDTDQGLNMGATSAEGKQALAKFKLTPHRQEDKTVRLKVEVLFAQLPTAKERRAMLQVDGKSGRVKLNLEMIIDWIEQYQHKTGHYPKSLKDLDKSLPKDAYSPTGEDYYYESHSNRFILRSCGKDGIHETEDDVKEIRPLRVVSVEAADGKTTVGMMTGGEDENTQNEHAYGERPQGNCSISGKVVSAETGKPIGHARMYLHYRENHNSIFIDVASDGTFYFKDIPKGPFSLTTTHVAGYQDIPYNPDEKPGPYPPFSLKEGEQRSGIVLKAKRSYCISGKVLDENGKVPEMHANTPLLVAAWHKEDAGKVTFLKQGIISREDGSYFIDGLDGKPVYLMIIDWDVIHKKWDGYPPIYYPSTFFRDEAKQITFDKERSVENIDITVKKDGGLAIEGTVLDEAGKPVAEALVAIHSTGVPLDLICTYTDAQGKYRISCVGSGEFYLHAEAVHRGFIRARTTVHLDRANKKSQHDFTLKQGINISGKFVDEEGNDWQRAESHGRAEIVEDLPETISKSFWMSGTGNQYNTKNSADSPSSSYMAYIDGKGKYPVGPMFFPTKSTFLIQGMMPGDTKISFEPKKAGQKVLKILYQGKDILESGIKTEPGQDIEEVTIVIGK